MIKVYSDISMSQKCVGVGLVIEGLASENLIHREYLKPGLTTVEAEIFGIFRGLDLMLSVAPAFQVDLSDKKLRFFTDSEAAIKAIYDLGKFRSRATKALVKNLVETLREYEGDRIGAWQIQPVPGEDNPADSVSREARQEWSNRWKLKARGSGPSPSPK